MDEPARQHLCCHGLTAQCQCAEETSWDWGFGKGDKLSPFPHFRADLLSVSFHQGEEPFIDVEEMVRPQITWKFENICSSNDCYVNAESC